MPMKIAIIGLANSGKTTVFNALTRGTAETTSYASGQLEPNIATVKVPDQRLNVLAQMFDPKKNTPADVQYVDVGGLSSGARQSGGLPPALLNFIGGSDALLHVARAFEDETVAHPEGSVNLARDIESVDLELAFSDMAIIERRLVKLNAEIGKTASKDREPRVAERDLLVKLLKELEDEDASAFMEDLGISTAARDRAISLSYGLLGLISFLTAGPDEVRAWTINRNTPAVEAAGAIHSDIQRGFIRAEIVAYDDLIKAGGMTEAKKQGTVRMEGKTYIVKDGDVCHFLFNV